MDYLRWPYGGRSACPRLERLLIVTASMSLLSLMMILNLEVNKPTLWTTPPESTTTRVTKVFRNLSMPAMKTIVAYSPDKLVEMERRPSVQCDDLAALPPTKQNGSWTYLDGSGISIYAAYYDDRIQSKPFIRILAVTNETGLSAVYCQWWSSNMKRRQAVEASVIPIWWNDWDPDSANITTPILLSCPISSSFLPSYLALTTTPCSEPLLAIDIRIPEEPRTNNFTVCVKDLDFQQDITERLVEWLELLKILGADKVDVYVTRISEETRKLLEYYSKSGFVNVMRSLRSPASSLWQRRRDHLLSYNDCLYRNLYSSRYVIPLDIDEIIVPRGVNTWKDMLGDLQDLEIEPPGAASLAVSNAFFFDSFIFDEKYSLHMLKHLRRSSIISPAPEYSKSFVSTLRALAVFNHYALWGIGGAERARAVPIDMALLHHYKEICRPDLVDCHKYTLSSVKDDTILKYADKLTRRVGKILRQI